MRNNELSAWTLLVTSVMLGSVTMISLSGCKPPTVQDVDISTNEVVQSNTTTSESNITTDSSEAVETPGPAETIAAVPSATAATAAKWRWHLFHHSVAATSPTAAHVLLARPAHQAAAPVYNFGPDGIRVRRLDCGYTTAP